ncbi:MAG: hypothetical protein RL683_962, partial [Actinomycetota bacterium]
MSEHAHAKNFDALKTDVVKALRSILALSAIATTVMIVLSFPIGAVFASSYESTKALGLVLAAMMLGLIPFSVNFMLQRVFYALEDTKSPFVFTTIQIVVFVISAYVCAGLVPAMGLVAAISLAMSISFAIQALIAYFMLVRRIGKFTGGRLFDYALQVIFAAVLAGVAGAAILWSIGGIEPYSFALSGTVNALISCVAVGGVAILVYVFVLWLMRNDEIRSALSAVKGILRR